MNKFLLVILVSVVLAGGTYYLVFLNKNDEASEGVDIVIDFPKPGDIIASPLRVSGRARGNWYFEASAPLRVEDSAGNVLGMKYITAQGDWMTTDFVPFEGEIEFTVPETAIGKIIFQKDNPSGLPEYDKSVEVPVKFR